jgi:TFIIH basal transcription factor complex TTD-A subunit
LIVRADGPGVLVECDPSIKSIIVKIDNEAHEYVVEELDDSTLVIKETMLPLLKARLDDVSLLTPFSGCGTDPENRL